MNADLRDVGSSVEADAQSPTPKMEITDLPFVQDTPDGRDFWHVVPSGEYDVDCHTGEDYALAFLRYEAEKDRNVYFTILPWIASANSRPLIAFSPIPWTRLPDRRESLCLGGVMG